MSEDENVDKQNDDVKATSLEDNSKVEEQTTNVKNENDLLNVVERLQQHMQAFTESVYTKQIEDEERNEQFKQSVLQMFTTQGQSSVKDSAKNSPEVNPLSQSTSQDVRQQDRQAIGQPDMTPANFVGEPQYFQTMLRGGDSRMLSGQIEVEEEDLDRSSFGDRNDNQTTAKALEKEEKLHSIKKEKDKLFRRMTSAGGTKCHVQTLMEEELEQQNILKRAEEERVKQLSDPNRVHTETSLAWHLQWQKDMKQQVPSFLTSLSEYKLTTKSKPEDWIRWIDAVKKYAERSSEHLRNAKADWRKTVHSSLYALCYNFNYKYNISERANGIDDGRVFFRLRSTDTSHDIDLPVGFRMEFNGNLDDLSLEPFMILLTLMATPLDAQEFCLLVIKLVQKQFGTEGPLLGLPSTKMENVRNHYLLTEDFLSHLVKYYNQVTGMVQSAKEGYYRDPDFKRGISLIYTDKSPQRDLLQWFIKNMGSPALKNWWTKRTEELLLLKSLKSVKKDKRYSVVKETRLLEGGKKPRSACVTLADEVKLILDDFLDFYNVCEKVVQFSIDNKDKSVHLPANASSVKTTSESTLSAIDSPKKLKDGKPFSKGRVESRDFFDSDVDSVPDLMELDGKGYSKEGYSDVDSVHMADLVSDSEEDSDEDIGVDRMLNFGGESREDIQRASEQDFSNTLDDIINHGITVDEFEKHLNAFDATYYRGDDKVGNKKLYDANSKTKTNSLPRDFKDFCYHYILGKDCPGAPKCKGYGNWNWADGWRAARYLLAARQGDDEKSRMARKVIHLCMDRMEQKMIKAGIPIPSPRVFDKKVNFKSDEVKVNSNKMRKPPAVPRGMAPTREMAIVKKHQFHKDLSAISVAPDLCKLNLDKRLEQKHAFKESMASLPDHVYQNMLAAAVADDRVTQVFNFKVEDFGDPTQARLFSPNT